MGERSVFTVKRQARLGESVCQTERLSGNVLYADTREHTDEHTINKLKKSEAINLGKKAKGLWPCVAMYKNPTPNPHPASVFEPRQANATLS